MAEGTQPQTPVPGQGQLVKRCRLEAFEDKNAALKAKARSVEVHGDWRRCSDLVKV